MASWCILHGRMSTFCYRVLQKKRKPEKLLGFSVKENKGSILWQTVKNGCSNISNWVWSSRTFLLPFNLSRLLQYLQQIECRENYFMSLPRLHCARWYSSLISLEACCGIPAQHRGSQCHAERVCVGVPPNSTS